MKTKTSPQLLISLWFLILLTGVSAGGVPSLLDNVNPLPGAGCPRPWQVAANTVTHRIYALSESGSIQGQGALSIVDADTNKVVGGFATKWPINTLAVNESTNRIYLSTYTGTDPNHLVPAAMVVDGATNQVIATYAVYLGYKLAVDPVTGHLFVATGGSIEVYDGDTLASVASMPTQSGGDFLNARNFAVNSTSRRLYVTDNINASGNARIGVYDIDQLTPLPFISTTGWLGNIEVDPSTNKAYAIGVLNGGSGSPAIIVIDGAGNTSTITLPPEDYQFVDPNDGGASSAIDPSRHSLYLGANGGLNSGILVVNTQTNSVSTTLPPVASKIAVMPASGKLYVCQRNGQLGGGNAIGAVDSTTGAVKQIVLAYEPFAMAINRQTDRIYVADEEAAEVLALNGSDHTILARITIGTNHARHNLAVSESLNRVYVARSTLDQNFNSSLVLDVIDGATNQVVTTLTLPITDQQVPSQVAVDDTTHHIYVSASRSVCVLNTTDNSVITTFSVNQTGGGIAVNPVTHRLYVSGGNSFAGNNVTIINTSTNQIVTVVSAGAIPGPIAVNTQTNKIYVANTGAGSVDNSVTVINGATDSVEQTLSNTNANNGDAVSGVAVDEATNTLFVCDNANGFDLNGRITVFDANNNYAFKGQVGVGRYPVGAAFQPSTHQLLVANDESGTISILGSFVFGPIPPVPAHGGLSDTVFAVDENKAATDNVADTTLRFLALQTGTPAGLVVSVQATTTPNNDQSWINLNNGSGGYMTLDKTTNQFVLNTTNYPLQNGVYFRAISKAPGFTPDTVSNVVGPFNLAASQNHLASTTLYVTTNGNGAPINFRAIEGFTPPSGTHLRIQSTTSPHDESSWTDLNDGQSGMMYPFDDPTQFYLNTTHYGTGNPMYYRAVASALGYVSSLSNAIGVNGIVEGDPPIVDVLIPLPSTGGPGLDVDHPLIVSAGTLNFGAHVSDSTTEEITTLGVLYDGNLVDHVDGGATTLHVQYFTNVGGDHIIKAYARDDRDIKGYADPIYIRIVPPNGHIFTMASSGSWNNANNWRDENNNPGVPSVNDFAVVGSHAVTITQDVTVYAITLNGGSITGGGGGLTVTEEFLIAAGALKSLNAVVADTATLNMVSDTNVPMSGSLTNYGTFRMAGRGSIVPVPISGSSNRLDTDGFFDGVLAFFKNIGNFFFHPPAVPRPAPTPPPVTPPPAAAPTPPHVVILSSFENHGRLLTQDGAGLIGHDGSSLLTQDGAGLIGHDGSSVIAQGAGNLLTQDGAGLLTQDGAGRPNRTSAAAGTPGFTQVRGEVDLTHLVIVGSVALNGGILSGSGAIDGNLTNSGGFITPGHSAGGIYVTGDFEQDAGGMLIMEDGGKTPSQFDQLQIGGSATLGGKLDVHLINGYQPDPADMFNPLSYTGISGSFASVSSNAQLSPGSDGATVSVNPGAEQPPTGQPANISTRMRVLTNDKVLIGGFIVTGPNGSTKKVLIRGMGPTLGKLGVPGSLSDPLIELHYPDSSFVTNDDWQQAANHDQIPPGFQPDPKESALLVDLAPGAYTVIEKGAHGETGIGLTEIYDFDGSSTVALANISTRGFIDTGDNVMIGGFIVDGTEPAQILVRGTGPTLTQYGVAGALADPVLELHDANGNVISNDDWRETQEADIQATTIPPSNDKEPAILATLVPGSYTAIVRGKDGTTGIGLVEAYKIK